MTLMCWRCGLEAEETTYKGEFAAACPNCEKLLYRPVGDGVVSDSHDRIKRLVNGGESR